MELKAELTVKTQRAAPNFQPTSGRGVEYGRDEDHSRRSHGSPLLCSQPAEGVNLTYYSQTASLQSWGQYVSIV